MEKAMLRISLREVGDHNRKDEISAKTSDAVDSSPDSSGNRPGTSLAELMGKGAKKFSSAVYGSDVQVSSNKMERRSR